MSGVGAPNVSFKICPGSSDIQLRSRTIAYAHSTLLLCIFMSKREGWQVSQIAYYWESCQVNESEGYILRISGQECFCSGLF